MATTIERAAPAAPVVTVPDSFNIADYLVDGHIREGRGGRAAILCGDESVTYAQVADRSSRLANGLRSWASVARNAYCCSCSIRPLLSTAFLAPKRSVRYRFRP